MTIDRVNFPVMLMYQQQMNGYKYSITALILVSLDKGAV